MSAFRLALYPVADDRSGAKLRDQQERILKQVATWQKRGELTAIGTPDSADESRFSFVCDYAVGRAAPKRATGPTPAQRLKAMEHELAEARRMIAKLRSDLQAERDAMHEQRGLCRT